jgi:hypothetical protein
MLGGGAAGCRNDAARNAAAGPRSYYGPTDSFETVVRKINANNELVPTLWARHDFEATVVDDNKRRHEVVGDGALLYRAPRGLLIKGVRPGLTLFEIGSTEDRYWLTLVPEIDTAWWGSYANIGKPCVEPVMPIRPDLVLQVLGVGTFDTDLNRPPVPTMRFNHDADAYMFVWNAPLPSRWAAQREVWYDRQTLRPSIVILFDADGRVVLRAFLSKHQQVRVPDVAERDWPWVATEYRLFFPESGTKLWLNLSEVALDRNGAPSRRGIVFPRDFNVANVRQIDRGCEGE